MKFSPSWAWVLASCISASLAGASNLSDEFLPLQKESPGQLSDYHVENGNYIINPWNYSERIGMYKILLTLTARYFENFAPENEQSILWGLPIHHGWQYHTSRLADPTHRTNCGHDFGDPLCISVDSWADEFNVTNLELMTFYKESIQTRNPITKANNQTLIPAFQKTIV